MQKSFEAMAGRQITGRAKLVDAIARGGRVDKETANKIADLYIKEKIAKLSINIGQFTIKHGAFLDDDVIANAAEMVA